MRAHLTSVVKTLCALGVLAVNSVFIILAHRKVCSVTLPWRLILFFPVCRPPLTLSSCVMFWIVI
jgi:hypothetical protein